MDDDIRCFVVYTSLYLTSHVLRFRDKKGAKNGFPAISAFQAF